MAVIHFILGLPWSVLLLAGGVLLYFGAGWLVDGAVAIARAFGVSTLIIGLTIVAAGTSAPELAVNVIAAIGGNTGLSFGNVVGSNIANIGLVIGIGAVTAPIAVHGQVLKRELPLLLGVSIACMVMPYVPTPQAAGFAAGHGVVLLVLFIMFLALWYVVGRRDGRDPLAKEAQDQVRAIKADRPVLSALLVLMGCGALFVGGYLTREGAVSLARQFEVSEAMIGLTVVAIATSLPEVFTVWAAARKSQADLAVGNVVGSNVFNLLFVLGVTSVVQRVPVPEHGLQDLVVMLVFTLLLLVFSLLRPSRRLVNRFEGLALLILYVGYLVWCVYRELP